MSLSVLASASVPHDSDAELIAQGGLLNICKPSGITSFRIVKEVRRIIGAKKVGHCGTLDPLASGVLLIVFGKATRLVSSLMDGRKVYRGVVQFGTRTDTGDVSGKTIEESPLPSLNRMKVEEVFREFTGVIEQTPPMYSALKHQGKRLYEYARKGISVERAPRKIEIDSLDLLALSEKTLEFRVVCSKGTYVRTLAEDIGRQLGSAATLLSLVRESVGPYSIRTSVSGESLLTLSREELLAFCQQPVAAEIIT